MSDLNREEQQQAELVEALEEAVVLTPSLGRNFSGINATMEALLPLMRTQFPIACWGTHLSERMPKVSLWNWLRSSGRKRWRIWHARRNNDMLLGLFLRYVLRQKLILLFTSAAQRRHKWLTRFCYRKMDAVIATTNIAASYLECHSIVSHHGVNCQTYQVPADRSQVRAELKLPERPTIGVFGRVRPQKGTCDFVEALIQVLPDYPDWQVVFVGAVTEQYVEYRKNLEQKLKQAGLADRVIFHGYIKDFSQLPMWYQAVDAVGCVSRVEGFGLTCLEGMASGVPVLATQAGAWAEIVDEAKTGWITQPENPADLARGLKLLLETPFSQLQQMGLDAREAVEQYYSIEQESARIISVYQRLLSRFNGQHSQENGQSLAETNLEEPKAA